MAWSSLIFSCDCCNFRTSAGAMRGVFNYCIGDKTVSVDRALGWCDECATLTPIEVLPDRLLIDALSERQNRLVEKFASVEMELRAKRSWFGKLLNSSPQFSCADIELRLEIHEIGDRIDNLQRVAELLIGRKSPPRCLLCGSSRVQHIPEIPELPVDTGRQVQAFPLGFAHHGCGGNINVSNIPSKTHLNIVLKKREYDREGRLVFEGLDSP